MRALRSGLALVATLTVASSLARDAAPLEDELQRIRDATGVPALAAMISRDGLTDVAAVGVRKAGDPIEVSIDDRFHLGSDTKAMTATLVALLVDRHALAWTSTLGELLPDLVSMDPAFRNVTIEMLLAHRSGLGSESTFDGGHLFQALRDPKIDPVAGRHLLVRAMLSSVPEAQPGSVFRYSNANYVVIGSIVERIERRSWEESMRALLFEPLAMSTCGFGPAARKDATAPDQPWGHQSGPAGMQPVHLDNPEVLGPAGTVHCSLRDWMTFVTLHMDAFNGRPRLVSAESFRKLHAAISGQEYTCGGWIRTERAWAGGTVFSHDGSNTLNYATVWWAPLKETVVLAVSNGGLPEGQRAAQQAVPVLLRRAGLL
jgi:CubicO group peptidase (beta-lactamase class C family)